MIRSCDCTTIISAARMAGAEKALTVEEVLAARAYPSRLARYDWRELLVLPFRLWTPGFDNIAVNHKDLC